jgi:autotransporter-associated beta strand protein
MKIAPALSVLAVALSLATTTGCSSGGGNKSSNGNDTGIIVDNGTGGGNDTDTGGGNDTDTGGGNDTDTGGGNDTDTGGGNDTDTGGGNDTDTVYRGIADNLLVTTGATTAQAAGYTGTGVKVGLLDTAPIDGFAGLPKNVVSYTDNPDIISDSAGAYYDHGSSMASIIAGEATINYDGGIAPDADIYWTETCQSDGSCSSYQATTGVVDLLAKDVKIFNLSQGTYQDEEYNQEVAPAYSDLFNAVVEADALVITATGNDGAIGAASIASAPYYLDNGTSNTIAVTAVTFDSTGAVSGKSSFANSCGVAMNYCISAPGSVLLDSGNNSGTSVSTAIVTGVAATVSQAFPWMTGSNLQTTLLTTATDLGDAGVDESYGWGLVNAAKAIYGPAQFTSEFDANVASGYDSTFSNDISGIGGLSKSGDGTLRLSGTNTYNGGTSVDAGTLALTGSLTSNVTVNSTGIFESDGGVIHGDYTTTGTTAIYLDGGLTVNGTATLDGQLNLLSSSTYTVPSSSTFLTADAVSGTFDDYTAGSSLFNVASISYETDSVTATLSRVSSSTTASWLGLDAAVVDGGSQLDTVVAALDRAVSAGEDSSTIGNVVNSVAAILSTDDLTTTANNLQSVTGEIYGTARTLAYQQASADQRIIADRVNALSYNKHPNGLWMQAYGGEGTLSRDGYDSARIDRHGFGVGIDGSISDSASVGLALFTSESTGQLSSIGGNFRGRTNGMALYGRQTIGDHGYLSALVGYSDMGVDISRTITYGTNAEALASDYTNEILHGRLEAGWKTAWNLTPYTAIAGYSIKQGGIHETTDSGLGLQADSDRFNVTLGELGLRYGKRYNDYYLGANLSVSHILDGENTDFTAAFDGLPDETFRVVGQQISKTSANLGLHGVYSISNNVDAYADINYQVASDQTDEATAAIGIRIGF